MTNFRTTHPYEHDVITVKKLGKNHLKITKQKTVRKKGWEQEAKPKRKRGTASDSKNPANVKRACATVEDLGMNNEWIWFCTFTIDASKMDRYDLPNYLSKFKAFLKYENTKCNKGTRIKYVYVQGPHKLDRAWHIHGLFCNIPKKELFVKQKGVYGWESYEEKFGFSRLEKVSDIVGIRWCIVYMKKHIIRTAEVIRGLNMRLVHPSKNLKRGETILKFSDDSEDNRKWDYENEHCKGKVIDLQEESLEEFLFADWEENHSDDIS